MANPIAGKALSDIEIEEMLAKKALDRSMFSRLLPLLKPIRGHIFGVIGIELLLVFTVFLRPWFIRELLDRGLIQQDNQWLLDERLVLWLGLGLAASWLGRFMLAGASQFIAGSAAIQVLNDLRVRVFAHVQSLSVGYFDRTKAGRIISRADRDVDALEPLLIQGPPELLGALLRVRAGLGDAVANRSTLFSQPRRHGAAAGAGDLEFQAHFPAQLGKGRGKSQPLHRASGGERQWHPHVAAVRPANAEPAPLSPPAG